MVPWLLDFGAPMGTDSHHYDALPVDAAGADDEYRPIHRPVPMQDCRAVWERTVAMLLPQKWSG